MAERQPQQKKKAGQAQKNPQQPAQKGQQTQQQQPAKKGQQPAQKSPQQAQKDQQAKKGKPQEARTQEATQTPQQNNATGDNSPGRAKEGERREPREKNQKPKKDKETGKGVVKAVLSGDRVVVYCEDTTKKATWTPPKEREIKLSSIKAPKPYAKGDWGERQEEKFAWHSKNFLRELLVGKAVEYTIDAKVEGREYGTIKLLPGRENVSEIMVQEGWAEVSVPAPKTTSATEEKKEWQPSEFIQRLQGLEENAKKEEKGQWTTAKEDLAKAITKVETEFDATEMYKSYKNQKITAIVENVINGSMLRLLLLPFYREIVLKIAGVQSPLLRRQGDEPFAREAQFTSERYLLQRRVEIIFTAFEPSKKDNKASNAIFHGEVILSEKSIGELLLSSGLAEYVEWSAPKEKREVYRRLQTQAQQQALRIWSAAGKIASGKTQMPASSQPRSQRNFTGIVKEVPNGSAIVVLNESVTPPQLVSVTFSSINVPRLGVRDKPDEPFAWEAREFVRKKLIGKRVNVSLDYVRPEINLDEREKGKAKAQEGNEKGQPRILPEKSFYTVLLKGKNIALALVEHGYATVLDHWGSDRSPHYDALFLAQDRAKKRALGLHGNPEQFEKHYTNDVSRVAKKAKSIFATLARKDERLQAIVEYVISGSRVKLNIPAHNILVTFCLAGARCEGVPREEEIAEGKEVPLFAIEARDFTRNLCLHFDVEVELDGQEKSGAFRGFLWVNGKSLATLLLHQGLAKYTRCSRYADDFQAAENEAKQARRGIWHDYDPVKEAEERQKREEALAAAAKPRKELVQVTEVIDGRCCYVHILNDEHKKLGEMMTAIGSRDWASLPPYAPQIEEPVLAQFPADGLWYRAKVLSILDNGDVDLIYADYGNADIVPGSLIRKLDPEFGLDVLPWQARQSYLAYIQTRSIDEEWGREAALAFKDLVWDKTLLATIEYRDGDRYYISLWHSDSYLYVNAELVKAGLAKVEKRLPRNTQPEFISYLHDQQNDAFRNHRGLWEYGDDGEDDALEDAKEFGRAGKPKGNKAGK